MYSLPEDEASLLKILSNPQVDTSGLHEKVVEQLMLLYLKNGDLKKALKLGTEFSKKHPESVYILQHRSGMTSLDVCLKSLDSLNGAGLPGDELLWAKGQVLRKFCTSQDFREEEGSIYNLEMADSMYQKLIRQYPTSPRAEDADFQLIQDSFSDEGGNNENPEEIQQWKKYLKKYPRTKRRAEVLLQMVSALGQEPADLKQALKWMAEGEKLNPELFSSQGNQSTREELQRQLDQLELVLGIQILKNPVRTGEPVRVNFTVKNTGASTKKIQVCTDSGHPNVILQVTPEGTGENCVRSVVFAEGPFPANPKHQVFKPKNLGAGKTYSETWDITKTACKYGVPNLGGYVFDHPGTYILKASWQFEDETTGSEPVKLIVQ
jgi:hypothetical protein